MKPGAKTLLSLPSEMIRLVAEELVDEERASTLLAQYSRYRPSS